MRAKNPLPFPARKCAATVARERVNTIFQPIYKFHALRLLCRGEHFLLRRIGLADLDIIVNAGVEQEIILRHKGNFIVQGVEAHVRNVLPAQSYLAAADVIVMHQQFCERALARTGFADQRRLFAFLHHEAGALNDVLVLIGESHVLEHRRVVITRKGIALAFQRLGVQSLFEFLDLAIDLRERRHEAHRLHERTAQPEGKAENKNEVCQL